MKTVEVSRITDIPSQTIWNEMKHFDRVLNWVPGGNESSISVKGKGVGAIRDITLITQGYVQHELVAYSDKDLSFSYKLTDGNHTGIYIGDTTLNRVSYTTRGNHTSYHNVIYHDDMMTMTMTMI